MYKPTGYTEDERELDIHRNYLGITDEEEYGCKLTDEERLALFRMKRRIKRRISNVIDEEIKMAIYKIKTGKDL